MSGAEVLGLMGEPSPRESRRDDDAMQRIVEEEQRRVARRGPASGLKTSVEDVQMSGAEVLSLMGEPSPRESRRDDDAMQRIVEEEQRRVARRGPASGLKTSVEDV